MVKILRAYAALLLTFPIAANAQHHDHAASSEKLGSVDFTTSCSATAQFNRAVAMLHSFGFLCAIDGFGATLAADREPSPRDRLAAARAATAKFHDISSAYAAGYTTQFEPCVDNPGVGAMGVHARNEPFMGDQLLDPLRPELLVYAPRANGGYRLIAVEYFEIVLLRNPGGSREVRTRDL